ncbi:MULTISPECIES: amidophosphoribosyltransferase [unclassified Imperialibacter]|uniref:amidophosphoribosyltransferase n=1 Tax=unclassified Imperialibacter TaxID=2629706 RepID=UPI0012587651|nr:MULTISPECIES: amidophosphoribosyltransferase [unclassified Imperialibacter]CAD5272870.1 Amidophosphoribosyltransferase [Imperialibacter sp. 89]CAD5288550.1 Amidophosphoribosyltransferase [Imperialibacter sp. 75]VVT14835.1 Amidophosphoribosyltransferase [Imperialibacter sp. EC-SDR9]
MSDQIKHECGIALIRLRKPLQYYIDKYQSPAYGASKLYLLMEKQHNRGQDGAGVANIKINIEPGYRYISRYRSIENQAVSLIFDKVMKKYKKAEREGGEKYFDAEWLKKNYGFTGELWLGHLRYGTHGVNSIEKCHPFLRQNNWRSRNLVVAGNFNMTNVDELFKKLIELGQHPKEKTDTVTVMEKMGHFLDEENQLLFDKYKDDFSNQEITDIIEEKLDLKRVLKRSCKDFDGGYAMAGLIGHGSAFVARDPAGIRPAYYYADDEVVVVASEKPAIKTAFGVNYSDIKEIEPGSALIIEKDGSYREEKFIKKLPKKSCSFERIYFSRGSDPDIYQERKMLGELLVPQVLKAIDHDLQNTVFSYIPNTAETAFLGLMAGMEKYLIKQRKKVILKEKITDPRKLEEILSFRPRVEKLVIKDAKLRTFITDDQHRDDLVANVYDTTYEVVKKKVDTLVVIDDSIVRGTTLEKSILTLLDRLEPKKIVVVSSAPQIRFPDCYGIDMSKMKDFIAFRAVLKLLEDYSKEHLLDEVYEKCVMHADNKEAPNFVKELYDPFTDDQISEKISEIVKPKTLKAEVEVLYQTVPNLHKAIPGHSGDWYFTGDYPTPGGNGVVNRAFINFMRGVAVRAY